MAKHNLGQEILESIQAIKRGEGRSYTVAAPDEPKVIRERMKLGISAFASLLGVSVKTLRNWEEGKRKPSGASKSLLVVAARHPEVLLEILQETSPQPVRNPKIQNLRKGSRILG